jgi:hypothetical protein
MCATGERNNIMKKLIMLAILAIGASGCGDDEPTTVYHHHAYHGQKTPPSVSSGRAEDFRAVERPSTYSE